MIILLVLQIGWLRTRLLARQRRAAHAIAIWRPVITAILAGMPGARPATLGRSDEVDFLKLWLHFQANLRGEARQALNRLARELDCEAVAMRLLRRGDRGEQLLAVLILGHLGTAGAVEPLRRVADSTDPLLQVHATISLSRIDPQLTARSIAPVLIANTSWPVREVVTALQEARAACEPVLGALLPRTASEHLPRLLQVMEGLRVSLPPAELAPLLRHASVEVVVCALRGAASPSLRAAVLALVAHEDWRVRMHAGKALGRLGQRGDIAAMIGLLSDSEWWVRYRTAQALAAMPFLNHDEVRALADQATDRFAGDMLRQVLAEGGRAA